MVKKYSVGIDIAAKSLAISVLAHPTAPELVAITVDNSIQGISSLFGALRKAGIKAKDCWFCFEHTGNYGLLLGVSLQKRNCTFSSVAALEIKSSQGVQRGKTDAADARQIAMYAAVNRHKLKPCKLPEKSLLMIKELLSYRSQLIKIRTQLKNSIKSRRLLGKLIDNKWVLCDLQEQVLGLNERVKKADKAIEEVVEQSELAGNYHLAKSVKSIGPVIAAAMVVYTNNFAGFDTSRQFSSYAGIAPFRYESGSSIRGKTKVSNYANKRIKTLLYNAANTAIVHDPEMRAYYLRKRALNKHHCSITNAVAAKLIGRIFAVVKRQTPYVSTYAQKIA